MLFAARVVFWMFYLMWHFTPPVVVVLVLSRLLPPGGLAKIPGLPLVLFVWWLLAMYATSRRSWLAARAYAEQNMSFLEAHASAGAVMKAELSFLPVIGRWFGRRE